MAQLARTDPDVESSRSAEELTGRDGLVSPHGGEAI